MDVTDLEVQVNTWNENFDAELESVNMQLNDSKHKIQVALSAYADDAVRT